MIVENENAHHLQWATELLNTATPVSTSIYRSFDPACSPQLGYEGCQTLYEALRHGLAVNPFGPCLGFRAVSTTGNATPFVYSSYTEVVARVDAIAAGLDDLNLLKKNEDGLAMVSERIYFDNALYISSPLLILITYIRHSSVYT